MGGSRVNPCCAGINLSLALLLTCSMATRSSSRLLPGSCLLYLLWLCVLYSSQMHQLQAILNTYLWAIRGLLCAIRGLLCAIRGLLCAPGTQRVRSCCSAMTASAAGILHRFGAGLDAAGLRQRGSRYKFSTMAQRRGHHLLKSCG